MSPVDRLDLRVRLLSAVSFSIVVAVATSLPVAVAALFMAGGMALAARFPRRHAAHRFLPLNVFVFMLFCTLPFSTPGIEVWAWGPLAASREGLRDALLIGLKANAVVLFVSALFTGLDPLHLGHALERLHVPPSFTRLMIFTVRYGHVLDLEYRRLRTAMRARGFRPGSNVHTLRTFGYLVGMLLVRALERSDRILAAMKCRGFAGHYPPVATLRLNAADAVFALAMMILVALLITGGQV